MNESQFLALCDACDHVLLSNNTSIERVAIPWLHVIREHPMFLQNYVDLFESSHRTAKRILQLPRLLRNEFGLAGRGMLKQSNVPGLWFSSEQHSSGVDLLFVSHLLNVSHAGREDDFYFGTLPGNLASSGFATMVALIDHSGRATPSLARKWDNAASPRVILAPSLGLKAELALRRRLKRESIELRRLSSEQNSGLLPLVFRRAADEAMSGWARTTLRIYEQIRTLVKLVKPRAIVVTYEGHAWERLAFAATKESSNGSVCVGYQHAALFRLQHAARRRISPRFDPDHILTAGRIGKRQLQSWGAAKKERVTVMGSIRHGSSSHSLPGPEYGGNGLGRERNACLVIPEGVESECRVMFEFSMECASACPHLQFIWRLHPLVKFETLLNRNRLLKKRPPNVVLSQDSLENDIAKCRWSLYRGTTAVIQTVNAGLRPLYLGLADEMTIDPLYELDMWKVSVQSIREFVDVVESDLEGEGEALDIGRQEAIRFCSQMFEPLNEMALVNVIENEDKLRKETG